MNKQIVKQCTRNEDREGYKTSYTLSKKEIYTLEKEANQPTIQNQREQLEADIKEVKEILYKLELKLVKLR